MRCSKDRYIAGCTKKPLWSFLFLSSSTHWTRYWFWERWPRQQCWPSPIFTSYTVFVFSCHQFEPFTFFKMPGLPNFKDFALLGHCAHHTGLALAVIFCYKLLGKEKEDKHLSRYIYIYIFIHGKCYSLTLVSVFSPAILSLFHWPRLHLRLYRDILHIHTRRCINGCLYHLI